MVSGHGYKSESEGGLNAISPHHVSVPGLLFGNAGTEHQSEHDFISTELLQSKLTLLFFNKASETGSARFLLCVALRLKHGSQVRVLLQVAESIVFVLFFCLLWLGLV